MEASAGVARLSRKAAGNRTCSGGPATEQVRNRKACRSGQRSRSKLPGRPETEARSGKAIANQNAALAHHAASQFELAHGDMELALADERSALVYAPEQPVLLMNAAYIHLRRSEFTQSLEYLEHARRLVPEDPEVSEAVRLGILLV